MIEGVFYNYAFGTSKQTKICGKAKTIGCYASFCIVAVQFILKYHTSTFTKMLLHIYLLDVQN